MKIADGVYVHFIPTQKYKTNRIVFRMTGSLNKQTIAKRALVSQMLATANQTYPTVQSFKERLASLYGTQLSTKVSTKGLTHSVDIELTYLKDFFIPMNTSLFWEVLGFLMDCLYNPLSIVAQYQNKVFDIEKQNLMTYLDVDTENNYYYSEVQGRELYFVNEALKVPKYGRVELVEAETSFTAYQEFQSMLTKDRIDIFMVGEFDDYQVLRGLHRFPLEGRQVDLQFSYNQPYSKVVKEKIETRQTSQSILQLGYQFPCQYGDKDYFALIVFNGMLGEFAHSALFTKIREKEGLAYSIGSQFDAFTGLLEIYAGIEKSNRNQAMRGIIRELNHIKLGRFSSSLLNQTKKIIRMNALLSEDHALTLVEQHFNKVIFGDKKISLEDWLDKIEKVTKKDVCRIARQVKLQSLFFLEGVS